QGGPGAGKSIITDAGAVNLLGSGGLVVGPAGAPESLSLLSGTASPDAAFLKFGDGTGWKLHIAKRNNQDIINLSDRGEMLLFGGSTTGSYLQLRPSITSGR